jgi:cytochrome c oxidase cbb3-type subunit I
MISLILGGPLKGMNWMDGKPFIESVVMMMPFWLWRAIGGTLMLISHFVFAYNLYELLLKPKSSEKLTLNFINSHVQLS